MSRALALLKLVHIAVACTQLVHTSSVQSWSRLEC